MYIPFELIQLQRVDRSDRVEVGKLLKKVRRKLQAYKEADEDYQKILRRKAFRQRLEDNPNFISDKIKALGEEERQQILESMFAGRIF